MFNCNKEELKEKVRRQMEGWNSAKSWDLHSYPEHMQEASNNTQVMGYNLDIHTIKEMVIRDPKMHILMAYVQACIEQVIDEKVNLAFHALIEGLYTDEDFENDIGLRE